MPPSFSISPYRPSDDTGIKEIYPEVLEELAGHFRQGILLVARQRGRPIGFLFLKWFHGPAHHDRAVFRYGEILEVHVHPSFWNRGVATALTRRALHEATRRGCEAVYLVTDDFNAPARHVYEKCGFHVHNLVVRYKRIIR